MKSDAARLPVFTMCDQPIRTDDTRARAEPPDQPGAPADLSEIDHQRLFGFIRRRVASDEVATEIQQLAYQRFVARAAGERIASARALILTIAVAAIIDWQRRQVVHRGRLADLDDQIPDAAPSALDALTFAETQADVIRRWRQLTPTERANFLAWRGRISAAERAAQFGITEDVAKKMATRTQEKLLRALDPNLTRRIVRRVRQRTARMRRAVQRLSKGRGGQS